MLDIDFDMPYNLCGWDAGRNLLGQGITGRTEVNKTAEMPHEFCVCHAGRKCDHKDCIGVWKII